jgi:hypothetical protein
MKTGVFTGPGTGTLWPVEKEGESRAVMVMVIDFGESEAAGQTTASGWEAVFGLAIVRED